MKSTLIQSLPETLQSGGNLTATGHCLILLGWAIFFGFIGLLIGMLVYRRFRYAAAHLEKDNQKNSNRLAIYQGTVEKQLRVHNQAQ